MNQDWKAGMPAVLKPVVRGLEWVGSLLLFAMMALTFVDVIGRYFFNHAVTGGFEMTELMLASLIFFGLPLVTLRDGHISVDLLENILPNWFRQIRDRVVFLLVAGAYLFLGYRLWIKAGEFVEYSDQTAVLLIPIAPVVYAMSVLSFLSAAIAISMALTGRRTGQSPTSVS
jgi:TRAP-type C4-dicarboxylate transport system permease small subunit